MAFASRSLPENYRPCAGVFLINRAGKIFAARRIENGNTETSLEKPWQLPQGGIDPGETPRDAVMREMLEEIGAASAEIIAESRDWHCYDLPPETAAKKWGGRYRGQAQKWFALRFTGTDAEINLETEHPEFCEWKWVDIGEVCDLAVSFKREVYERIAAEFAHLARPVTSGE